jgi:hypothetical protein
MNLPRQLRILSSEELCHLTEARLLAYRKKALSLENSPEESDYTPKEIRALDMTFVWFKSDPRWQPAYDQILRALASAQKKKDSN